MTASHTFITQDQIKDMYYSSFEDKYIIMDNLEAKSEPIIHTCEEKYNSEYVYVVIVLRGTLHIAVGNTDIEVRANEYLAIMPCMKVTIRESRCLFFSFLTRDYIMNDIYDHCPIGQKLPIRAFIFRHVDLSQDTTNVFLECYQRIKKEHKRPNYSMKEAVFRAYHTAYIAKLFSLVTKDDLIPHIKNSKQDLLFNEFITKISQQYKQERSVQYYANTLGITPKYLSTITQAIAGCSASIIIDQYVTYAIKQALYINEHNIKAISKEFNFPSQSFFGRYFKRVVGMSPYEYIKQYNRKSLNFIQTNKQED